jgi:hypothetical protein
MSKVRSRVEYQITYTGKLQYPTDSMYTMTFPSRRAAQRYFNIFARFLTDNEYFDNMKIVPVTVEYIKDSFSSRYFTALKAQVTENYIAGGLLIIGIVMSLIYISFFAMGGIATYNVLVFCAPFIGFGIFGWTFGSLLDMNTRKDTIIRKNTIKA